VHQARNRLPDDLVDRVPVQQLGAALPGQDEAVDRPADDGIGGRIDNRGEQPRPRVFIDAPRTARTVARWSIS
jgi:hypothetical protein